MKNYMQKKIIADSINLERKINGLEKIDWEKYPQTLEMLAAMEFPKRKRLLSTEELAAVKEKRTREAYDAVRYTFVHKSGTVEENITIYGLKQKYDYISMSTLKEIRRKRFSSHKGWKLKVENKA